MTRAARLLVLAAALLGWAAVPGEAVIEVYRGQVRVDGGRPFDIDVYYPTRGRPYLALDELARGMGWRVDDDGRSPSVTVDGRAFTDLVRKDGRTFVDATGVGQAFGYKVDLMREGRWVDYWTSAGRLSPGDLDLTVRRQNKVSAVAAGNVQGYELVVEIRNLTSASVSIASRDIVLVDSRGQRHTCLGDFRVGVPPRETAQVDRLYYNVPRDAGLREVVLEVEGQRIDDARW